MESKNDSSSTPLMSESELRNALHSSIDALDLTSFSAELPPLEKLHSATHLSIAQLRRCLHGKADIMDLEREMWACETLLDEGSPEYTTDRISELCITALQDRLLFETMCAVLQINKFTVEKARCKLMQNAARMETMDDGIVSAMEALVLSYIGSVKKRDGRVSARENDRAEFLEKAALQRPQALRVIDIEATCLNKEVMIVEYDGRVQQVGYSAISHTYGMEVYEIFDCQCTARFSSATMNPRCRVGPCSHDAAVSWQESDKRDRVVNDILHVCDILREAGVQYAWHDGVCIAQHDEAEVEATIKCMGWVYSFAMETIIFLHYVGEPMAPIRHGNDVDKLACRWHTRVWTLQETALSKCRRYCIRVGFHSLGDCDTLEEFEKKIAFWYRDDTSKVVVIEERHFFDLLVELTKVLQPLYAESKRSLWMDYEGMDDSNWMSFDARITMYFKASIWRDCLFSLLETLIYTCFIFPTAQEAIERGSARDSKHIGDHINSILAITGVKDFVAPKDINMKASTLEFFKRQGQQGLEYAVFAANEVIPNADENAKCCDEALERRWLPYLTLVISRTSLNGESGLEYEVLEDGKVEVRGELVCLEVEFTVKQRDDQCYDGDILAYSRTECAGLLNSGKGLAMELVMFGPSNFKAVSAQDAQCTMGIAVGPYLLLAENGETYRERFWALLVWPRRYKSASSTFPHRHWPILVVEGDLHAPEVHKLGCFKPSVFFAANCIHKVDDHRPHTTLVNKLIIS